MHSTYFKRIIFYKVERGSILHQSKFPPLTHLFLEILNLGFVLIKVFQIRGSIEIIHIQNLINSPQFFLYC